MRKRKPGQKMAPAIRIGMLLFAAAFCAGAAIYGSAALEDLRGDKAYEQLQTQVRENAYRQSVLPETPAEGEVVQVSAARRSAMDFAPLTAVSSDIVAWLYAEGTVIDYPVLHTTDNEYYLTHLYTGESNRRGSLFADFRNTGLFTEKNTVIYGHNMRSGAMFHSFEEYKAQDYYDAVPAMTLYTPAGDYLIELFSGTVEDGSYEFVRFEFASDEEFLAYVDGFRARSTFRSGVAVGPADKIVSLCTCSYEQNNARYMLMGKLTPIG